MYKGKVGFTYRTCVCFNEPFAAALRELIDMGFFSSESEAFRQALIRMVKEDYPDIYEKCFIKKDYDLKVPTRRRKSKEKKSR